ncbi:MAG: alpha-2-macroglobulin [Pseudomonadota bacterium]
MLKLIHALKDGIVWLLELIAAWLQILFGMSWQTPWWMQWLGQKTLAFARWCDTHRRLALLRGLAILLIGASLAAGVNWYKSRPKPVETNVHAVSPALTQLVEGKWITAPLVINFKGSAAPLDKIGKVITPKIRMTPSMEGAWAWQDDKTLVFTPRVDWPVGMEYKLSLPKKGLVASHVTLDQYELSFRSAPFEAALTQTEFYQDPSDPKLKKIVATVSFSHPVDSADFEKRVTLRMKDQAAGILGLGGATYPAHITFDKNKLSAYIHSDPVAIPEKDSAMLLKVDSGIRAARGGPATSAKLEREVAIPGVFNFFRISSTQLTLARNDRFEPEQVFVLETTTGVEAKELAGAVTAHVLPIYRPDAKEAERKYPHHWSAAEVGPEVLKQATPLKLATIATEADYATLHSYKYQAEPGRFVHVRVKKGIKSFGGYVMAKEYETVMQVPAFPKELKILYDGAILSLSGEKKVSLYSRDIEAIKFEIGRVVPSQIQHLLTQSYGDFKNPQFENDRFGEDNITERFNELRVLDKVAPGKTQYHGFDLSRYLDKDNRRGLFLLKAEAYDREGKQASGVNDRRLILVTDLGVLVKDALNGSHDVFVQSIYTGEPVAGAKIEVLGKNGQPVVAALTDANGHAILPTLASFVREQAPTLYLVQKGNDLSFLPFNRGDRQLSMSRFDIGGVGSSVKGDRLAAYLFSDRGLYRPGDEIRVGLIVKPADWKTSLEGVPLEVEVLDARGLPVKRQKLRLSASGFEEIIHTTQDTSPTGTYTFNVYIVKDKAIAGLLGSTTVRVQEFLPDRMKITAHLSAESAEGWVSPDNLKGLVSLANLFGTPAVNRRVSASIGLFPAYPSFSSYADYHFYDPLRAKDGYNEPLPDATTNEKGEAEFDLNLQRFAKATYRLRFNAQGFEAEGGRSVAAEAAVLVSPLPYLVGYKADGDLQYINKNAKRVVELIAINPETKKIEVAKLSLQLIERRYVSVLIKQDNGTFKYESKLKEIKLSDEPLKISSKGLLLIIPTDKAGDFSWVIRDAGNTELNRIEFTIAGHANLTRSLEKNAELQLKLSKPDYSPGEDIELQIKAPYVGYGLITIERERVYSYKWFKTTTTASVQKIKLPTELEGNGYVSVAFVRSINSEEIFMSPLSYGVAPFSVSRAKRTTQVSVTSPDLAKPGQPYRIRYKTDRPAKIVVYAVDEGILQVARYKTPDPLGYFFQKRALEVRTSQILDLILPEFKRLMALSAPGGDQEGALGKNLNPFKRKREKPVAFWSGIIEAGPKEKELVYNVPDYFNGTLRVMAVAVAVATDSIGTSERRAQIRGDFVLNPNVPTFVTPGDEFDVSVSVANNITGSGKDVDVQLELKTSPSLQVIGPARVTLKISEMREASATFKVRALNQLGSANLTFVATRGKYSGKRETDLSVRPAVPYMTTLSAGRLQNGKIELPVTRQLHAEYRTQKASISPLPLNLAHGLASYLEKYPYGCTEQLVSQAVPATILKSRPEFGHTSATADKALASIIATLRARQNAEGGFGLWAANTTVVDFVSVYATHYLIEARERGYVVPPDMLENSKNYLTQLAQRDGSSLADERTRAYAIYVLTRTGIVTTPYAASLQKRLETQYPKEWKKDSAAMYLAATYKLLRQERLANSLAAGVPFGEQVKSDYAHYYDPLIRDSQVLYLLARHFPERLKNLDPKGLEGMVNQIARGHYNTLSSSYAILALDAYASAVGMGEIAKYGISEILAKNQERVIPLPGGLFPTVNFTPDATKLRFTSDSKIGAFYLMTQAGFDTKLPTQDIKNGLEVTREYTDLAGKPLKSVKLGDEIEVHVKLRSIGGAIHNNIAVVDLLPGGFEVVLDPITSTGVQAQQPGPRGENAEGEGEGEDNSSGAAPVDSWRPPVGSAKSTWAIEYADVREDRVVLYGTIGADVKEFVYKIKATNTGTYVVPPTFGESMYDRTVQARSLGGKLTVEKK